MQQADRAIVVGGGVVGLCTALAMQRRGRQTLLIDPAGQPPAASYGNAGHIAIEQVEPQASQATLRSAYSRLSLFGGPIALPPAEIGRWLPFALRLACAAAPRRFAAGKSALSGLLAGSMPAWRRLAESLQPSGLLIERGHAVVWHDERAAAAGLAAWREADIGTARFHPASREEIDWLARAMKQRPAGAILFENTGQVADPGHVLEALATAFRQAGGEVRRGRARSIVAAVSQAALVMEDGERLAASALIVAAGVESAGLLAPMGLRAPIIAERGYHIQSAEHHWPADLPPVVFEERSMIVSRFTQGLRAAGFVEFGRHGAAPDMSKWRRLEHHVAALGLPVQGNWRHWVGSRPTLPDYLPAIGRAGGASNLYYAFGHQHLGLTLGPITGEIVAELVCGAPTPVPLAPFDLARFR